MNVRLKRGRPAGLAALVLGATLWVAPPGAAGALDGAVGEKFTVDGDLLIYDSDAARRESEREITWDDAEALGPLLRANPQVSRLQLNSGGGVRQAARYMADVVLDFRLDTHVSGECASGCVDVFLAGAVRTVERGSWIGFHRGYWEAEEMARYYEDYSLEEGWESPFDFASWVYEDAQNDVLKDMEYMLERGVAPRFIIETLRAGADDMWYPRRAELLEAGVITHDHPRGALQ